MNKKILQLAVFAFILGFFISLSLDQIFYIEKEEIQSLDSIDLDLEAFSKISISGNDLLLVQDYCNKYNIDFCNYLASFMTFNNYEVDGVGNDLDMKYYSELENKKLSKLYHLVFDDIKYFPVKTILVEDEERYEYVNSFLAPRTYGGDRLHMGIDIMDCKNEKGYFPIVSMTDGIVSNLGWLELGGYRVGITSKSGTYFYYAHLDKYADGLKEGNKIKAGQLLGYMGSTGYGEEGTCDQFPVHLHIGIAIPIVEEEEFWVNPYPVLQMYDKNK